MAVVTEQTIPFPSETLDLASASRWNALFPLFRPTVKPFPSSKGQTILIDTAKSHGKKYLHIVAVGPVGNFSSKLLDDKHVTAIVAEKSGAGILTAADLPQSLSAAGVDLGQGVCMVRAGTDKVERKVVAHKPDLIEVECQGDLEADHAMHLLGTATGGTRANPHVMVEMLKGFVKSAKTREVVFTEEKVGGSKPGVKGADGQTMGYEKAREVIQKEVEGILNDLGSQEGEVVYSVHFSDVNGLSRLENYIVAGEIAQILDRQGVKYALSHSTLLNHNRMARGFGVSIAPIPVHFLDAAPKPQAHKAAPKSTSSAASNLASSKIQFEDKSVRSRISNGCNAVIAAEPVITEYDTVVGDGDCGYTLRDGAKKVLDFVSDKDLSRLPAVVADLVRELEVNMGGTSGALYCIFLTALANSLASAPSVQEALAGALTEMCKYTRARVGDRTMMDALIPFIEGFQKSGKPDEGLKGAKEGVEGTKRMEAKLGRSTYLDESATRGVPDPGAYGLLVLLEGMCQ